MKRVFLLVSVVVGLLICVSANVEAAVPSGQIIMYSGAWNFDGTGLGTGTLEGWALCNGSNSTPNLTGRFIYGWTAGVNPGGTGGATSHLHTYNHYHYVDGPNTASSYPDESTGIWATQVATYYSHATTNHTHGCDIPWISCTETSVNTSTVSHLPPYIRLAFVMKL